MLILAHGGEETEMESMNLVKQFMKAMSRFRKMDYSVLHPGAGNGEFAALELISCHSRPGADKLSQQAAGNIIRSLCQRAFKGHGCFSTGSFKTLTEYGAKRIVCAGDRPGRQTQHLRSSDACRAAGERQGTYPDARICFPRGEGNGRRRVPSDDRALEPFRGRDGKRNLSIEEGRLICFGYWAI